MVQLIIGREYPDIVSQAIKEAKSSIKILMYDWRWYQDQPGARIQKFNQEIIKAARRGVDVRAIINHGGILHILNANGVKARKTNSSRTMHIKMVIIDNQKIFIGSHNFSINAFEINQEISLQLDDKNIIDRCDRFFNNLCLS